MIYTLTLNPTLDYDIYLDSAVTADKINLARSANYRASGKGINVSKMLKNLGLPSVCLGFAGGFTGRFILDELKKENIESNIVEITGTTRINVKINVGGTEHEVTGVPPVITGDEYNRFLSSLDAIKPGDYVFFSGSVPSGLPDDIYKTISQRLPKGVITVLDTRGNLLLKNLDRNFLVKPNSDELREVFAADIPGDPEQTAVYGRKLIGAGAENVIVSMGVDGAVYINEREWIYAAAPKGTAVNTMGAGDSVAAGFVYGKVIGMTDAEAFKTAVACGSATAFSVEMGSKKLVEELYRKIYDLPVFNF